MLNASASTLSQKGPNVKYHVGLHPIAARARRRYSRGNCLESARRAGGASRCRQGRPVRRPREEVMRGKRFSKGSVVSMVGGVAIVLGVFLAIAFVGVHPDGSTI